MDTSTGNPQESQAQQPFSNEEEIKILERRLQLLREGLQPLGGQDTPESKEAQEVLEGALLGEGPGGAPPLQAAPLPAIPVTDTRFHETKVEELKTYESDRQLKALVGIAFERGLKDAVDIARRLDDAYLLDAFHDTLQDDQKLRGALSESGKL